MKAVVINSVKTVLVSAVMMMAVSAGASSAFYEVDVRGLPGLDIHGGSTVWQPQPLYPRMALRRGLGGKVLVEYTINEQGKAENIVIVESSPRGFFDNATIRALENATFGVAYNEGKPEQVAGVKKRFIYTIERDSQDKPQLQVSVE